MPQFFLNRRLIVLLISIIILVALIGFSLRERSNPSWPEQFVKDTTGWVQSLVAKPATYLVGFYESLQDLQNTYQENQELKSRVDKVVSLEAQVQMLQKDNNQLRDLIGEKKTLSDFDTIAAEAIGRNPDRWHELIIIDKGKVNGISQNMAVMTATGLVGKVKSVDQFSSTVQLLSSSDPKNRVSAFIQGKANAYGLVEGYDQQKKLLLVKGIPYDSKIEKGQTVITSGLGGVFPPGLLIGTVQSVKTDQYGLTQTAYIQPGANFYDIENVLVIKSNLIQPSASALGEQQGENL